MVTDSVARNARAMGAELDWLRELIVGRIARHFGRDLEVRTSTQPKAPEPERKSSLGTLVEHYDLDDDARGVLALAAAAHMRPRLLDAFTVPNEEVARPYAEFGGVVDPSRGGFQPTFETALFLLAGEDLDRRFRLLDSLDTDHPLFAHDVLFLDRGDERDPIGSAVLRASRDTLDFLMFGRARPPEFSVAFPARRLRTSLTWKDLVLPPTTLTQLLEIRAWLEHGRTLLDDWQLRKRTTAGFKSLFHGPPGTGKSLSVALLGVLTGREVYRIDISQVVSKWVGETEKSLERIFRRAEYRDWILFFDEADALFGRRTQVVQSHDRFANQEVSYLLQRIEEYPGVVVLATNLRANLDDAFTRRFQSIVPFAMPRREERRRIWAASFSPQCRLGDDVDLDAIASEHELAGGSIVNVVRFVSLRAIERGTTTIERRDLEEGVRRELAKEGRSGS